jgi:hypothetical protein
MPSPANSPPITRRAALLPDVAVFHKAVDWALRHDEFMAPKDVAYARTLLARGTQRAAQLRAGQAPWLDATGVILRGHRSRLDGSVQPYAVYVPEALPRPAPATGAPLVVWLLGRGEKTHRAHLPRRARGRSAPTRPAHRAHGRALRPLLQRHQIRRRDST